MLSALDVAIKADNGATDYNGAFAKSDAFGSAVGSGPDQTRLKKIAKDTGGRYFPVKDTTQVGLSRHK